MPPAEERVNFNVPQNVNVKQKEDGDTAASLPIRTLSSVKLSETKRQHEANGFDFFKEKQQMISHKRSSSHDRMSVPWGELAEL